MIFVIKPGQMTLADIRGIYRKSCKVTLDESAWDKIKQSRKVVDNIIEEGKTVYGINTGFGLLAQTSIPDDQLSLLQTNLVLSHSTGVGRPIADDVVRLIYVLKISSLAQGHSGIRISTIEAFIDFVNAGIIAEIPEKGSVGASGDLAPLAHMTAALMGEGYAKLDGQRMPATQMRLKKWGLNHMCLTLKKGWLFLTAHKFQPVWR